jgi:uncharacterized protein DUF3473/polysaccharide deacetylase
VSLPAYGEPVVDILLTIDVEDWFQVENFKKYIPFSSWSDRELRVEKNTHRLLDLFDSIELGKINRKSETSSVQASTRSQHSFSDINLQSSIANHQSFGNKPKATFFILGWIAERLPNLVREIHSRGHEVASHGYCHELCRDSSLEDLRKDLTNSKKLLEDTLGERIYGYRAPSFSINDDILKVIEDCGYLYDSSYNSFGMHGRYGKISLNGRKRFGIACEISNGFFELPISNLMFSLNPFRTDAWSKAILKPPARRGLPSGLEALRAGSGPGGRSAPNAYRITLPWGGGGYFRLIPFPLFRLGVQSILKKGNDYLFYFHPWEIDPEQPRVRQASSSYKFRHYVNLKRTQKKLTNLINGFSHCRFPTCRQYLEKTNE